MEKGFSMRKKKKLKLTWPQLVKKTKSDAKTYEKSESFYVGDCISHKYFGVGFVQLSFGNKIEVLFEDRIRTLIHMVVF